jgi:predicted glycoside hydrolase/deacetylase ChbG (UPF0249 family)
MTHHAAEKRLIVNADDFGLTTGVNRGITEAHEHGIVTSASLMVRGSAAREAAEYARRNPSFSVGLHFDAAEWRYKRGEWVLAYKVVDSTDADAVRKEIDRQLADFVNLMGGPPTHLDSHQHMHLNEPARGTVAEAAARLNVPLRSCTPAIRYRGHFYGQTTEGERYADGISVEHLAQMIAELADGWTEFGAHPGYADGLDSVYATEREDEVRALCSEEVRAAITAAGVKLCSFHDLRF